MPEGKRAGEVVSSPMPSASYGYTAAAPYPRDLVSQISPHLSQAPSGSFIAAPSVASTGPRVAVSGWAAFGHPSPLQLGRRPRLKRTVRSTSYHSRYHCVEAPPLREDSSSILFLHVRRTRDSTFLAAYIRASQTGPQPGVHVR